MRLLYFFAAILFLACGNSTTDPWVNCKHPKPKAIFDNNNNVSKQHFELKGMTGTETVLFRNDVELELIQSGCEDINQEFKFKVKGNHTDKSAEFWIRESIKQFRFMSGLSPKLVHFGDWASAIEANAFKLKLGQETELAPNIYISIDKIVSSDVTLLLVVLSNK